MESPQPTDEAARTEIRATLAKAGIALPEADIVFLAAQRPMLARTIAAVAAARRRA